MKPIVESFYNWYSSKITHPQYRWIIILGTMVYLFSPLDISPDVFPIIGWIDDAILSPPTLTATPTQTNILCNNVCNGAINLNTSGGTLNYSYVWSPNISNTITASALS